MGERLAELIRMGSREDAVRAYAKSLTALPLSADERQLATETEACIEAMFLMAAADGDVAGDELLQLSASVRALLEPFEADSGAELTLPLLKLNDHLARFQSELGRDGMQARLANVAGRLASREARCLAFCLAAAVAFVDDFVAGEEASLIDDFAEALGLERDESQYLLREVHERLS